MRRSWTLATDATRTGTYVSTGSESTTAVVVGSVLQTNVAGFPRGTEYTLAGILYMQMPSDRLAKSNIHHAIAIRQVAWGPILGSRGPMFNYQQTPWMERPRVRLNRRRSALRWQDAARAAACGLTSGSVLKRGSAVAVPWRWAVPLWQLLRWFNCLFARTRWTPEKSINGETDTRILSWPWLQRTVCTRGSGLHVKVKCPPLLLSPLSRVGQIMFWLYVYTYRVVITALRLQVGPQDSSG